MTTVRSTHGELYFVADDLSSCDLLIPARMCAYSVSEGFYLVDGSFGYDLFGRMIEAVATKGSDTIISLEGSAGLTTNASRGVLCLVPAKRIEKKTGLRRDPLADPDCSLCKGTGVVDEAHPDFDGVLACECLDRVPEPADLP